MLGWLGVLPGAHGQSYDPRNNQAAGYDRRETVTVLGLHTHLRVADLYAVIFGMRNGNGEGKYAEYQENRAKQS
jgi:hypothetical protein